jgi:hypothetical protein
VPQCDEAVKEIGHAEKQTGLTESLCNGQLKKLQSLHSVIL